MAKGKISTETRFYISSMIATAQKFLLAIPSHWASVGDKECAFNMGLDYTYKIRESNEYKTQISNVIKSYAWFKVSHALGKTKITRKDGTTGDISMLLESQREKLGKLNVLTEANKLAIQICSTIPKCIQ